MSNYLIVVAGIFYGNPLNKESLTIAIMGTRGIPARYGGFETFAQELSTRLVMRGHRVTVYGRRALFSEKLVDEVFQGVTVRFAPTIMHKYLETPLHGLVSFLDLFRRRYDVVLLCNAANAPFAWIVRLLCTPLVINVDGIERRRGKWNVLGRAWYLVGEISAVLFSSKIVADAQVIADYYRERYKCSSTLIGYGASVNARAPGATLKLFGLQPRRYLLYVSRLEPENNALGVIQAYCQIKTDMPLVVVGDAPYAPEYKELLNRQAREGVIFTGYQFGESYQELQSNCGIYIQATEVGGTHPALVEAMAYGNCVVANDVPEHREVLGDAGLYYRFNDFSHLAEILSPLLTNPAEVAQMRLSSAAKAASEYSWDSIVDQYELLLKSVCPRRFLDSSGSRNIHE